MDPLDACLRGKIKRSMEGQAPPEDARQRLMEAIQRLSTRGKALERIRDTSEFSRNRTPMPAPASELSH